MLPSHCPLLLPVSSLLPPGRGSDVPGRALLGTELCYSQIRRCHPHPQGDCVGTGDQGYMRPEERGPVQQDRYPDRGGRDTAPTLCGEARRGRGEKPAVHQPARRRHQELSPMAPSAWNSRNDKQIRLCCVSSRVCGQATKESDIGSSCRA